MTPFAALPASPVTHFRLHFYAAVFRLVHALRRLAQAAGEAPEEAPSRFPFLEGYLEEMGRYLPPDMTWGRGLTWWEESIAAWEGAYSGHLPLRALAEEAGLTFSERTALLLVGLGEEDAQFGGLFARMQPTGLRRPTPELLARLDPAGSSAGAPWRRLLSSGLVEASDPQAPRPEWELSVPPEVWDAIRGDPAPLRTGWCHYRPPDGAPRPEEVLVPEPVRSHLHRLPALLASGQARCAIVRGGPGSDRMEALRAVAAAMGMGTLTVAEGALRSDGRAARLGALCTALRAMPVIACEPGPGETVRLPAIGGYAGPAGIALGMEGGVEGPPAERAVTLTFTLPGAALRRQEWERAMAGGPAPEELDAIAARFHLPGGYIRQAAPIAAARAALDGRERITVADVQEACRSLGAQVLETLATRLEPAGSWAQLVVSDQTATRLRELEQRCRHREPLLERLSPAHRASGNRGVRALLSGPSGTGKTLAARTLAAELGIDLYRVDLAAVVNKYIGETEKNLSRVLTHAEELDVVLLLDEGDALMARRSEVRSANDRYANLQTNYLLQRLERYQGIVLVTTNAGEQIDPAFQRRMDVVVPFLPPGVRERLEIWRLHLPPDHAVARADLEQVALRCELTGGQIRNAAHCAALLALGERRRLRRSHLAAAIQREYRKAGAVSPLWDGPAHRGRSRKGVSGFLTRLSGQGRDRR